MTHRMHDFPAEATLRVTISLGTLRRVYGLSQDAAGAVADRVISAVSALAAPFGCTVLARTTAADKPPIPRLRNIAMEVEVSVPGGPADDDPYGNNYAAWIGDMRSALAEVARNALGDALAEHRAPAV